MSMRWPAKRMKAREVPSIKILRLALGLTQEDFAARYQLPLGTLRNWEEGCAVSPMPDRTWFNVLCTIISVPFCVVTGGIWGAKYLRFTGVRFAAGALALWSSALWPSMTNVGDAPDPLGVRSAIDSIKTTVADGKDDIKRALEEAMDELNKRKQEKRENPALPTSVDPPRMQIPARGSKAAQLAPKPKEISAPSPQPLKSAFPVSPPTRYVMSDQPF